MIIETMAALSLLIGEDKADKEDTSGLLFSTAEDIRNEVLPPDHAPYIDEVTARFERKLNAKDERIEELEAKVESLKEEADSKSKEADAHDVVEDDSNDIDGGNSSVDSSRDMALEDSEDSEELESEDIEEDISEQEAESEEESEPTKAQGQSFEATYYSAYCDTGCTGVTATGEDVSNSNYVDGKRVIAVDPNVIPLGTSVKVTTPNETFDAIAEDTGGDIQGNRIDILVDSTEEAYSLGRHNVTVEVME